jgi:hypothetical protein
MKYIFLTGLLLCCLSSCHFATRFQLTDKKIHTNKRFNSGLTIRLLEVDSFNSEGIPVKYDVERSYHACTLKMLDADEIAAMLPPKAGKEYLQYQSVRDSIIEHNIKDTLTTTDTTNWENGSKMYRLPGVHWPVAWTRAVNKMDSIKFRHIKEKPLRTIYFNKNTRKYRWKMAEGDAFYPRKNIAGFSVIPGRWYTTSFHCSYGLLVDGTCTLYFSTDEKGTVTCKRTDYKNEGPF